MLSALLCLARACAMDKYDVTDGVQYVDTPEAHYLRNRSNLDIDVSGYIGIVLHKEHSPEVSHIPPVTPCICLLLDKGCSQLK
jgi:hypothetical protein